MRRQLPFLLAGWAVALGGLLLLGEKRSEEPYSRRDRALLESLAAQMATFAANAPQPK